MPYSYFEWLQGLFIVHSIIGNAAFKQFGALYMHNHDDKYPSRQEFEPGTPQVTSPSRYEWAIGAGQLMLDQSKWI